MQEALKSKERQTIWINGTFKSEIQKGEPNYFDILQNWFPPEIRSPLCNLEKFQGSEKITPNSCRNVWNLMNDKELGSRKLSKLKYRRGDQIIQTFCKIGSSEITSPLLNFSKFQDSKKSTPDSWRNDWTLMKDEVFDSIKLLRLKYRWRDQIILTFCKIGSLHQLALHFDF